MVQEKFQVRPCQVHRSRCRFGMFCSSSDEDEVSLAQRESRADFLEASFRLFGSLGVDTGGVRWFLSR